MTGLPAAPEPAAATRPVPACEVTTGDVLLCDGAPVTVLSARGALVWDGSKHVQGCAIEWRAGDRSDVLKRPGGELLNRVPRPGSPATGPGILAYDGGRYFKMQALEDAMAFRMARLAEPCADCDAAPGQCEDHSSDAGLIVQYADAFRSLIPAGLVSRAAAGPAEPDQDPELHHCRLPVNSRKPTPPFRRPFPLPPPAARLAVVAASSGCDARVRTN